MVRVRPSNAAPNVISVVLVKKQTTGLGFLVKEKKTKPHVVVSEIIEGGSAHQSGILRIDDVILSVNQTDLTKISYQDALRKIREVSVGTKAVITLRGPEGHTTRLQTVVSPGDEPRTVRITEPSPSSSTALDAGTAFKKNSRTDPTVSVRTATDESSKEYQDVHHNSKSTSNMNGVSTNRTSHEPQFSMLKNWETTQVQRDTLFTKASRATTCSASQCKGSIMNPNNMVCDPAKDKRSKEEIKKLAQSFIEQYFESIKRLGSDEHRVRLAQVNKSIDETGTYEVTLSELTFAAKTAWRNAPRCIGRIQWNKLQVYDCRKITSTAEMFEAICTHLRFATNKGNIRSCVTFFPPRTDVDTEFRVWNAQLIRYAGYRQSDGTVIGDPINVEFTQVCERIGWKGRGGPFDVLPLVLQANGQDPDFYELPEETVLEVQLRHPKYDWFEDLGLKWYAVPAVANMAFDIGGVIYPAAPFNGWFMGTEVARDLCDVARYNVLQDVAVKMGLDTKKTASLWKDTALLEMNVAILHSFQADNVTIMDHHSATESFMKHFTNEMRLRGGCPGDWVWLVPPISGSSTPIFHQEILNYMLNPSCLYQPEPWKTYKWKDPKHLQNMKKKINFRELAKSVLLTSSMMTKAMANRIKATILYATETGQSYDYAKTLQDIFNHAFDAKVYAMDEFDVMKLKHETLVLVVTSTFGNGDPPGNAEAFAETLHKLHQQGKTNLPSEGQTTKRFRSVSTSTPVNRRSSILSKHSENEKDFSANANGFLANVKFSVFGLGSRAYPHFCAFAHAMDTLFGEMEGERLLEIGEGDELSGQEESFKSWAKQVFKAACDTFCVASDLISNNASLAAPSRDQSKFRVTVLPPYGNDENYDQALAKLHRKKLSPCKLIRRVNLQSKEASRSTILVELDIQSNDLLRYQPGDHLGIFPRNDPELVKELISRLRNAPEEHTFLQLEYEKIEINKLGGEFKSWVPDTRLPVCTLWTAFTMFLDITTPPSPKLLRLLAECAVNEDDKSKLETLSQGKEEYEDWKFQNVPNLVEVLTEFQSINVEPPLLLSQLPLLQCRYYSISSSPVVHPGQVHLTVSVVNYRTQGGKGPVHRGVCSTYLDSVTSDDELLCFVRPAPSFRLPEDDDTPCVLVGPGTGIAPYRSFWQQRLHEIGKKKNAASKRTMALLFGCRHPDQDHLYKAEVEEAMKAGAISHAYTAFSREPGKKKKYVQDIISNDIADLIFDWLYDQHGHFYVCGDVTMAADVNKTLKKVIASKTDMSENEAEEYVATMKAEDRYHEDIFGVTLRTYEVKETIRQRNRANSISKN